MFEEDTNWDWLSPENDWNVATEYLIDHVLESRYVHTNVVQYETYKNQKTGFEDLIVLWRKEEPNKHYKSTRDRFKPDQEWKEKFPDNAKEHWGS